MRGQHIVISELFLFSLSMGLVFFIGIFFGNSIIFIEKNIEKLQAETILKELKYLLLKLNSCKEQNISCSFRFSFPNKVGDEIYVILLRNKSFFLMREADYKILAKEEIDFNFTLKGILLSNWKEAIIGYSSKYNKVYIKR